MASTLSYFPILLIFALLRHSPLYRYLSWVFPGNSFYAFILNKFYFLRQLSRSVEIHEFDELYLEMKKWLGENLVIKEEQALEARAQGFIITAIDYQPQLPTTTILHYRNIFYAIEFDRINKPGPRESTEIIRIQTAGGMFIILTSSYRRCVQVQTRMVEFPFTGIPMFIHAFGPIVAQNLKDHLPALHLILGQRKSLLVI